MKKIAIIGAGIAGLTAARHLKDYDVMVFEANEIGGRIKTLQIEGMAHDVGAEFFILKNTALMSEIQELEIEIEEYINNRAILLGSGKYVVFPTVQDTKFLSFRKKLALFRFVNYNIAALTKLNQLADSFSQTIEDMYEIFDKGEDIFARLMEQYRDLLCTTSDVYFMEQGIGKEFIEKVINPLVRPIYLLPTNKLNAFFAAMIFALKNYTMYRIKGGNQLIIDKMARRIKPGTIVHEKVCKIVKDTEYYTVLTDKGNSFQANYIFCATPLLALRDIEFEGFAPHEYEVIKRLREVKYNPNVYHYTVKGVVKPILKKIFRTGAETIFTDDPVIYEINMVHMDGGFGYFDITMTEEFQESILLKYFKSVELIHSLHWKHAYPIYSPDNIANIPTSNKLNEHIILGTDNLVSTMDTAVRIAKDFVAMVQGDR